MIRLQGLQDRSKHEKNKFPLLLHYVLDHENEKFKACIRAAGEWGELHLGEEEVRFLFTKVVSAPLALRKVPAKSGTTLLFVLGVVEEELVRQNGIIPMRRGGLHCAAGHEDEAGSTNPTDRI